MTEPDSTDEPADHRMPPEIVDSRAELLTEEVAAGSDDPRAQAEAILLESEERVHDPDAGI